MEGQFIKKSRKIFKETAHTIIFFPIGGKKEVVYSKRDVAKTKPQKKIVKPRREDQAGQSTRWEEMVESSEDETYVVSEETRDDESTPTDTTITDNVETKDGTDNEEESKPDAVETESEEMAIPKEMPVNREEPIPNEEIIRGKGKEKSVKASVTWSPPQRETRRRRPTERYGIDVVMQIEVEEKNKKVKE